ncbi:hypothetical protein [Deinococcus budaensis]|uniref:Uncharacterized protein n=1 Tax=Deinococcus budaensis TaxID=1665626 RepID=A0A7W8GIN8_9DEIO|nr:hypothetical protein [Deinococcus budaensis]MBB5235973.1 hypothetical protein [Deinococcus budaensis]
MTLDSGIMGRIKDLARSQDLSVARMIDELLEQALAEVDSELATTFLVPKLERVIQEALDKSLSDFRSLQARSAREAMIAADTSVNVLGRLLGFTPDDVVAYREEMWRRSYQSLRHHLPQEGAGAEAQL